MKQKKRPSILNIKSILEKNYPLTIHKNVNLIQLPKTQKSRTKNYSSNLMALVSLNIVRKTSKMRRMTPLSIKISQLQ